MRQAVLEVSLHLLRTGGLDGLSVKEVAATAGVNEASIYRRWGTRENLMLDALLSVPEGPIPVPDTGSLRADLLAYLRSVAAWLESPLGAALDRALAAAGDDPDIADARQEFWSKRYELAGEMITRAISRGELPATVDGRLILELAVSPLHVKSLLTREPFDKALPMRLVDAVLGTVDTE
ncbi:MAG TPA: TetR/AcrR family transcriptional regulator [Pseudonocardia sp.]|nr:TetR/AcrR family transcriptional regulator [Pseudonocardia sp.]